MEMQLKEWFQNQALVYIIGSMAEGLLRSLDKTRGDDGYQEDRPDPLHRDE